MTTTTTTPPQKKIPDTIQSIIDQCGGRTGLRNAFVYVGASQLMYKCPEPDGEYRSGKPAVVTPEGFIDSEVSLTFGVNGRRGQNWKIIISYEPDDTYAVFLWRSIRRKPRTIAQLREAIADPKVGEVLFEARDVYCDALQRTVEEIYDSAIKQYNGSFIPM
jgi:hypothetical protein